jgi:hypothetical protein
MKGGEVQDRAWIWQVLAVGKGKSAVLEMVEMCWLRSDWDSCLISEGASFKWLGMES